MAHLVHRDPLGAGHRDPTVTKAHRGVHFLPITILEVILNCIRLGLIVHPGTWASAVAASGFIAPSDALPSPSGYVPPGEYPPSPSGYVAKEDGTAPWDMLR